jgi:hypothetical protein
MYLVHTFYPKYVPSTYFPPQVCTSMYQVHTWYISCTVHAYHQRVYASGIAAEHAGWYARGPRFESEHHTQSLFFFFHVHADMFLYVSGLSRSQYILLCTRFVSVHTVQGFVTVCTRFVLVQTGMYQVCLSTYHSGTYLSFKVKA